MVKAPVPLQPAQFVSQPAFPASSAQQFHYQQQPFLGGLGNGFLGSGQPQPLQPPPPPRASTAEALSPFPGMSLHRKIAPSLLGMPPAQVCDYASSFPLALGCYQDDRHIHWLCSSTSSVGHSDYRHVLYLICRQLGSTIT